MNFKVFFCTAVAKEQTPIKIINPQIKPPVGPISTCAPPLKAEKTGKPNAPIIMYVKIQAVDHLTDNIKPQRATARVCKVNGTDGVTKDI